MRMTPRRALFALGVSTVSVLAAWLLVRTRPHALPKPSPIDHSQSAPAMASLPRAARTPPTRTPPATGTTALPPLAAATLAYYDRPGVRFALSQLRTAARRRCSTLVEFPAGERRITFRISSVLSADGSLEASSVFPDGNRAAACIRDQMRGVHLPAADGPTPLQINLSFLY